MEQKAIGPTFYDELMKYGGLIGEHFTWDASGNLTFFTDTPESVVSGVRAVYAAHDPTKADASIVMTARDAALASSDWMMQRHRDEVDMGVKTTLSSDQFSALLAYRQKLRDLPAQKGFPNVDMPVAPV